MVLFETDHVFMMKTGPLNSTACFGIMSPTNCDLALPVVACILLFVTLHKSPLSSIRVVPHLKAVQLSVISNFSIDHSTKTTLSLFNSKEEWIQQQFHSSPKKSKIFTWPISLSALSVSLTKDSHYRLKSYLISYIQGSKVTQGLVYMQISSATDFFCCSCLWPNKG